MRLQDKVAIITGAARGMGAAEARIFAKEGAKVILADIQVEDGQSVTQEIIDAGGQAVFVEMDVSKQSDWQRTIDAAISNFGKINVLVNNAGIIERDSLEETTEETWDRIMAVNAKGVFLGTKAVIPHMKAAGGGSIINISSISGMISVGYPAYNASKGAIRVFTKSAAVEYARDNIRVNSIHPGTIWTSMSTYKRAFTREERAKTIPMRRVAEPEEIAYPALFLASDESSYMTGSELVIDGGATAQ
jgi:cyclopentanol dehydrogenase